MIILKIRENCLFLPEKIFYPDISLFAVNVIHTFHQKYVVIHVKRLNFDCKVE